MRTSLLLVTVLAGCVAESASPTMLENGDDKSDGWSSSSFLLTPEEEERYFFECNEWFSCDITVDVLMTVREYGAIGMYLRAHPEVTSLDVPAYDVTIEASGLEGPYVATVGLCLRPSSTRARFELVTCGDELAPMASRTQLRLADPHARVDIALSVAPELRELLADYGDDYVLEGEINASWR